MFSWPAKAQTKAISVDLGKWKFVMIASTILNWYPGSMKSSVVRLIGWTVEFLAIDSKVLTEVVPTAMMREPFCFAAFMIAAF